MWVCRVQDIKWLRSNIKKIDYPIEDLRNNNYFFQML